MVEDDKAQPHELLRQLDSLRSEMLELESAGQIEFGESTVTTVPARRICFTTLRCAATTFVNCRLTSLRSGFHRWGVPSPTCSALCMR